MEKYLFCGEADLIRDTGSVLLAREAQTFEFLDELISLFLLLLEVKKSISVWTKAGTWVGAGS